VRGFAKQGSSANQYCHHIQSLNIISGAEMLPIQHFYCFLMYRYASDIFSPQLADFLDSKLAS